MGEGRKRMKRNNNNEIWKTRDEGCQCVENLTSLDTGGSGRVEREVEEYHLLSLWMSMRKT